MKFIIQKKALILSIIFFLLSCYLFVFLYGKINTNKEISQTEQEKWQTEETRRDSAKFLVDSIKMIAPEKSLFETHFVKKSDVVPFLDAIEKLASESNTKSEVTSVDVAADGSSLIVGMKASGSFSSIYKLTTLLENSPYDLEFTSVNMENSSAENATTAPVKSIVASSWDTTFQIKLLSFINQ